MVALNKTPGSIIAVVLILLIAYSQLAEAVSSVQTNIGNIQQDGWSASDVQVQLVFHEDQSLAIKVHARTISVSGVGEFSDISLNCAQLEVSGMTLVCPGADIVATSTPVGSQQAVASFEFIDVDNWKLELQQLSFATGRLDVAMAMQDQRWNSRVSARALHLGALPSLLQEWLPSDWQLTGKVDLEGVISGTGAAVSKIEADLHANGVSYSDSSGLQVGEALAFSARVSALPRSSGWEGHFQWEATAGEVYTDPWYVSFNEYPVHVSTRWQIYPKDQRLQFAELDARFADDLAAGGDLLWSLAGQGPVSGNLAVEIENLSTAYTVFGQPVLIGTAFDDLEVEGKSTGKVIWKSSRINALQLDIQHLDLLDHQGRFGLQEVRGYLGWAGDDEIEQSQLHWTSANLFDIQIGSASVDFQSTQDQLTLQRTVSIDTLGGKVVLRALHLGGLANGLLAGHMSASLDDLQLAALTHALQWPEMQGSLSGDIPRVDLVPGHLYLDGAIKVDVFGGEVRVADLEIQEPFSVAPTLRAGMVMSNLDLEDLTQAFSFGRIQGTLEGDVSNLSLVGWELAEFDAHFRSVKQRGRPKKISQRAIDNLTALGNGVSAGISGTFLNIFDDFSYSEIAMDVSLSGDRARIGGIDRIDGGYYLVRGALLPRIDVVGHNRDIAWKELVKRISDVRFEGAVVN
ncbi:MAG: hypothetical protein ACWA5Q_11945 [bacterium]